MGQVLIYAAGIVVGVLIAGAVAAAVAPSLPEPWRGAPALWVITASIVALAVGACWLLLSGRRR